jgi:hypothetical protein
MHIAGGLPSRSEASRSSSDPNILQVVTHVVVSFDQSSMQEAALLFLNLANSSSDEGYCIRISFVSVDAPLYYPL